MDVIKQLLKNVVFRYEDVTWLDLYPTAVYSF